jgi:hypothetical protein
MYVSDYIGDSFSDTIERFREAIDINANSLFFQIIKSLK